MTTTVRDAPDRNRYEVHVDGRLAGFADYRRAETAVEILHTEVDDAFEGQGLAQELTERALDDARSAGLAVLPTCPYVAEYIARNPEYVDLVPEERRARYGL